MIIENKIFKLSFFEKKNIDSAYLSWINDKKLMFFSNNKKKKFNYINCLKYLKSFDNKESFFFSILEKKKNKIIGTLTVYLNVETQTAHLGILIGDKEEKNKDYGYKVCKLLIQFFFQKKKIEKFIIGTRSDNIPMIKICKKLKMKLFFEENINKKKNEYFYLKKNKSNQNVGIFLGESGSKNQILSFLKFNNNLKVSSLIKYKKELINFKKVKFYDNLRELIMSSDYIIVGTGHRFYEKKILKIFYEHKVNYIAILDHFTSIYDRFRLKNKIYLPEQIWVFDKIIYERLNKKIKKITRLKTNYYLRIFKNLKKKKRRFIVYFTEPFNKIKKNRNSEDYYSMKYFLDNIYKLKKFRKNKVLIKLHPKHSENYIENLLGTEIKKIGAKIVNYNLEKLLPIIKYSFGLTTYAIILTSKLKIKTFHCKLSKQKINLINDYKILSFQDYLKNQNV